MLHAAKLYYILNQKETSYLLNKYKENSLNLVLSKINEKFKGINVWLPPKDKNLPMFSSNCDDKTYVDISVDFILLLGKADIVESDFSKVSDILSKFTYELLGEYEYRLLTLTKLEYRYDALVSKEDMKIIFDICKKTFNKNGHYKKKFDNFHTTAYFQAKPIAATLYDKEKERVDKHQQVKPYEKGRLRYEVRLFSRHFSYMKYSKKWKVERDLKNYFKEDMFKRYMEKYFNKFLFLENYHTYESAVNIIKYSGYRDATRKSLISFLDYVNKYGIENAKKRYKPNTYKNHIDKLKILNIAPLLVSKAEIAPRDYIENPLSFLKK